MLLPDQLISIANTSAPEDHDEIPIRTRAVSSFPEVPKEFAVGVTVVSRYHGIHHGNWHTGKITCIHADNSVDIMYDEGLQEHNVPCHHDRIRLPKDNTQSGRRRSNRITTRKRRFDDI